MPYSFVTLGIKLENTTIYPSIQSIRRENVMSKVLILGAETVGIPTTYEVKEHLVKSHKEYNNED